MHDINELLVKPMMRGLQTPFAQGISALKFKKGEKKPSKDGNVATGHITHFISHDWAAPFSNFMATVEKHCKDTSCDSSTTYYWVCTFANDQFNFKVTTLEESPFYKALISTPTPKSVVAIQYEGAKPSLSIGRIWCVFEMHFTVMLMSTDANWKKAGTKLFVGCGDKMTEIKKGAKSECGPQHKEAFEKFKGTYDNKKDLQGWSSYHAGVSIGKEKDKIEQVLPWITANDLCEKYGFDEAAQKAPDFAKHFPADTPDISQKCFTAFWTKFFTGVPVDFADALFEETPDAGAPTAELHTASYLNEHPERSNINTGEFSEASVKVAYPSKALDSQGFTFANGMTIGLSVGAMVVFFIFKNGYKAEETTYEALLENEC